MRGLTLMVVISVTLLAGICFGVQLESSAAQGKRLGEEGRKAPPRKRKTSNIILLVLALFLLAFIVAMTVIFCVKGAVPDTLIQYTLGAGGVEALLLAGIKITKVVSGEKTGESEDTYYDESV